MNEGIEHQRREGVALRQRSSQINGATPRKLLEPFVLTERL